LLVKVHEEPDELLANTKDVFIAGLAVENVVPH
jgi:hypothetical protein